MRFRPNRLFGKSKLMNPWDLRMLDGKKTPDGASVANWTGPAYKYWTRLQRFIEANYPGVFAPDWWFGGRRFGWSLRYKKSKSFCNLIPEKGHMIVMLTFGRDERARIEPVLSSLTPALKAAYGAAPTFHDGKWLNIRIDSPEVLSGIETLLTLKRKPNKPAAGKAGIARLLTIEHRWPGLPEPDR